MTMTSKRRIEPEDVLSIEDYVEVREARRKQLIALKRDRRMAVGPFVTFYFENYATMLQQVQEMLWIEKGGDEQLADELAAYNPLIPRGDELIATVMFEIDDDVRRARILAGLGGVEETISIQVAGERTMGQAEQGDGVERTTDEGKTSSIHFLHFRFTSTQMVRFAEPDAQIVVEIGHDNYAHMAIMPEKVRQALCQDFD